MQTKSYVLELKPANQTCSICRESQRNRKLQNLETLLSNFFLIFKYLRCTVGSKSLKLLLFFASLSTMHGDICMHAWCIWHRIVLHLCGCAVFVFPPSACLPLQICIADICERFEVRRKGCQGINLVSCCGAEKRPLPRIKHNLPIKPPYSPPQTSINNISAVQIR